MAFVYVDRARMTSATAGTGTLTLGAAVPGFQSFADAGVANGDTFRYVIEDGEAWETGTGTLSGSMVARSLIDSSTGSLLSLSGNAEIYIGLLADDVFTPDERAGIAANTAARHAHANKALLDAITAAFTTTLKDKLDAIAEQATKNQNDAYLLARANQTGTQAQSTVANLVADLAGKQASIGYTPENAANKGQANGYAGLDSAGKVPLAQINEALIGAMNYRGTWNASTNSPAIPTAAVGNKGYYYVVGTAGTTNISGITDWQLGDWIVSNGASWNKIDSSDQVVSVAGLMGVITAAALKAALALGKGDVGLGNADNTADTAKPVSTAQAAADALKVDKAGDDLTGGFTGASKALATSGTIALTPNGGNIQHCAKTAAVTFQAPTAAGVYTILVEVHNTNATGAVALTGFNDVDGDSFTTASGDKFLVFIAKTNSAVTATVKALP